MLGKKSSKSKLTKFLPVLFVWSITFFFYYPFLSIYFSGDDFFHFKVSLTDGSIINFIRLFGFYSFDERGIAFYRPLFREALFNIYYSLFGLESLPFRLTQLILHFGNTLLVYVFFNKFLHRRNLSIFIAFFYAITAGQVGSLYYLAGGVQSLGATMFMMMTLIFWLNYQQYEQVKFKIYSFTSFLFAMMSHELSMIIPLLIIGLELVTKNRLFNVKNMTKVIKDLWLYFAILLIYLLLNYFVIGFSNSEIQYLPNFSISSIANTYMWYSLWALGMPEMLVDYVGSGFSLNPNLMNYWGHYFKIIFPAFFASILILTSGTFYLIARKIKLITSSKFLMLCVWFIVALLPVVFLPIHKKTYYLSTSLPAFWGIVGYVVFSFYDSFPKKRILIAKAIVVVLIFNLSILSYVSTRLSNETYWAAKRGRLAERLIKDIKSEYPELPKGAVLYIQNDPNYPNISGDWGGSSTQAKYILNGSDALQLLYNDSTLEVGYEDDDEILSDENKYLFTAILD